MARSSPCRRLGYQFPELETKEYDSNWLNILVTVRHPRATWTTVDASLLTYELKALGEWLREIAGGDLSRRWMSFTEPNLSFEALPNKQNPEILRATFSHETAPPFMQGEERYDGFAVDFPLSEIDLKAASQAVLRQTEAFPQRAER